MSARFGLAVSELDVSLSLAKVVDPRVNLGSFPTVEAPDPEADPETEPDPDLDRGDGLRREDPASDSSSLPSISMTSLADARAGADAMRWLFRLAFLYWEGIRRLSVANGFLELEGRLGWVAPFTALELETAVLEDTESRE